MRNTSVRQCAPLRRSDCPRVPGDPPGLPPVARIPGIRGHPANLGGGATPGQRRDGVGLLRSRGAPGGRPGCCLPRVASPHPVASRRAAPPGGAWTTRGNHRRVRSHRGLRPGGPSGGRGIRWMPGTPGPSPVSKRVGNWCRLGAWWRYRAPAVLRRGPRCHPRGSNSWVPGGAKLWTSEKIPAQTPADKFTYNGTGERM